MGGLITTLTFPIDSLVGQSWYLSLKMSHTKAPLLIRLISIITIKLTAWPKNRNVANLIYRSRFSNIMWPKNEVSRLQEYTGQVIPLMYFSCLSILWHSWQYHHWAKLCKSGKRRYNYHHHRVQTLNPLSIFRMCWKMWDFGEYLMQHRTEINPLTLQQLIQTMPQKARAAINLFWCRDIFLVWLCI